MTYACMAKHQSAGPQNKSRPEGRLRVATPRAAELRYASNSTRPPLSSVDARNMWRGLTPYAHRRGNAPMSPTWCATPPLLREYSRNLDAERPRCSRACAKSTRYCTPHGYGTHTQHNAARVHVCVQAPAHVGPTTLHATPARLHACTSARLRNYTSIYGQSHAPTRPRACAAT